MADATTRARIAYARAWLLNTGRLSAPFDPPFYRASSQHVHLDTDAHAAALSTNAAAAPVLAHWHEPAQGLPGPGRYHK